MIKITNRYSPEEVERYYQFLISKKKNLGKTNGNGERVLAFLNDMLPKKQKIENFRELVTMDFETIRQIKGIIVKKKQYKDFIQYKKDKDKQNKSDRGAVNHEQAVDEVEATYKILHIYKNYYSELFSKERNTGERNNISLLENLGVVVCPYCNRDYINSRGNSFGANFDHFFDKDDFPFFALSLYNLIPSCATCNRIKGNDSIDFCPFDTASEANFHFEVAPRSKVKIRCSNQGGENLKSMRIEEAYQLHQRDVDEMFDKEREYCQDYRRSLIDLLSEKEPHQYLLTESRFDQMVYGKIADDGFNDFLNTSLSKLRRDTYDYIKKLRKLN
ncbi:TPA: hypothetical protein ACGOY6_001280 [Streptococcus suis]